MTLIKCCENCVYQYDGMCSLDRAGRVTNLSKNGCMYLLPGKADEPDGCYKNIAVNDRINPQEQPQHPLWYGLR